MVRSDDADGGSQEHTRKRDITGTGVPYGFRNISPWPLGSPPTNLSALANFNNMSEPLALISVLASVISLSGTVLSTSISVRDTIELLRARWKRKVKVGWPQCSHPSAVPALTRY